MNLYILRHASAGLRRPNPLLDSKRPLDKEGKKHCLQLAHVLNALNIQFDLIVSSPLKRCLQTASLVGTETGYEAQILHSTALAPEATLKDLQKLLRECSNRENPPPGGQTPTPPPSPGPLLVPPPSPDPNLRPRKGPIARVVLPRGPPTLQGLLDPRPVRALYAPSTKTSRRKTSRK